jgi:hypothetical protein
LSERESIRHARWKKERAIEHNHEARYQQLARDYTESQERQSKWLENEQTQHANTALHLNRKLTRAYWYAAAAWALFAAASFSAAWLATH